MPKKVTTVVTTKKKPYKKRAYKSKGTVSKVTRSLNNVILGQGFPKKMTFTHKYFDNFTMTTTAGATAAYSFSCNGMYDPNITAAGHQPMYFDQCTAIYDHYTVIGSKITFKISNRAATNTAAVCSIYLNDDTAVTPTLTSIAETTSARYQHISAGNLDPKTLRQKWSAKKLFGGSTLANTSLQGTNISNPLEQTYYQVLIYPMDLSTSNIYDCTVMIEYIAVWAELRDIGGS